MSQKQNGRLRPATAFFARKTQQTNDLIAEHLSGVGNEHKFMDIDKNDLIVDPQYQRDTSENLIREIAKNWLWPACGTITVAVRAGLYYVVDGNHRVCASRRINTITTLPCVVFSTDNSSTDAAMFLTVNKRRKSLSAIDTYRSLLHAKDATAVRVSRLLERYGIEVTMTFSKDYKSIRCIDSLLKCSDRDHGALENVFPLLVELATETQIQKEVLEGFHHLERLLTHPNARQKQSLSDKRWSDRVVKVGMPAIQDHIRKARAYLGGGSAKVWAEGVKNAINQGLRIKLETPDLEALRENADDDHQKKNPQNPGLFS